MAKTRLNQYNRNKIFSHLTAEYKLKHADDLKKATERVVKIVNKAIRAKYPESDMAVLRKLCSGAPLVSFNPDVAQSIRKALA